MKDPNKYEIDKMIGLLGQNNKEACRIFYKHAKRILYPKKNSKDFKLYNDKIFLRFIADLIEHCFVAPKYRKKKENKGDKKKGQLYLFKSGNFDGWLFTVARNLRKSEWTYKSSNQKAVSMDTKVNADSDFTYADIIKTKEHTPDQMFEFKDIFNKIESILKPIIENHPIHRKCMVLIRFRYYLNSKEYTKDKILGLKRILDSLGFDVEGQEESKLYKQILDRIRNCQKAILRIARKEGIIK